jgi:hypothetical protein
MSTPSAPDGGSPDSELIAVARACLDQGDSLDQAARAVLKRTQSPVAAIKALREADAGLSLTDAKALVDRCLPPTVQLANERLRDNIIRGITNLIDSANGHDAE